MGTSDHLSGVGAAGSMAMISLSTSLLECLDVVPGIPPKITLTILEAV